MQKLIERFGNCIRKRAQQDDLIGHFFNLIYHLIRSSFFKAMVPIGFAVIISVFASADKGFSKRITIASIIFFIVQIVTYATDVWEKRNRPIYEASRLIAEQLLLCIRPKKHKEQTISDFTNYTEKAFAICQSIYYMIKKIYKTTNHQVTLFNRKRDKKGEYIHLAAFGKKNDVPPGCANQKFRINDGKTIGKYYHQMVFERGITYPSIFLTKYDVSHNLEINPRSKNREEKIEQYIGYPIVTEDSGIVSLLQIDTDKKDAFGKNTDNVESFIDNILAPFVDLLYHYYCQALVVSRRPGETNE